jgi:signal peptidase II
MHKFNIARYAWCWIILLGLVLDQASKWFVLKYFTLGDALNVFPGFNLYLAHNKGIAFSMMNQGGILRHVLSAVSLLIIIGLSVWLVKLPAKDRLPAISLSLIIGGAIGNLIDRVRFGYVIDFIDIYYKNWHWPTFNLADSWVCIGAALLILGMLKQEQKEVSV